ncbi:hypothetical protein ABZ618_31690 [Streptomyces roseolus]|uniref:hypothetical protein n=1 Tax=Streptomyces roseolus TaxID=67358 RepID=UPI0034003D0F
MEPVEARAVSLSTVAISRLGASRWISSSTVRSRPSRGERRFEKGQAPWAR